MSIRDEKDLRGMEAVSALARQVLQVLIDNVYPGQTTAGLDRLCRRELRRLGAVSAPKEHYAAPCYAFYSRNEEVVHGLPTDLPLAAGDVLKVDITPEYAGYIADTARTVVVGGSGANPLADRLIKACEEAFYQALPAVRAGAEVRSAGQVIEKSVTSRGYFIVKELSGHGVGRSIHEEPTVPNYYMRSQRDRFKEGQVIALEPMICLRRPVTTEDRDGWTISTGRDNLAAHYEHTILITRAAPIILTGRTAAVPAVQGLPWGQYHFVDFS